MRRVIVIGGPTAAGKTDTSLALSQMIDCEIVCADARQVYRGLEIGTAKPPSDVRARVPHHLFDILEPTERVNAAEYARLAHSVLDAIPNRSFPVMVGGSGLYISAALDGLSPSVAEVDDAIRTQLQRELEERGRDSLYEELCRIDPVAGALYQDRNPRRITRALEVFRATGRPLSEHWKQPALSVPYEVLYFGVRCDRDELRDRIGLRTQRMWQEGLLDEVVQLLEAGVEPSMQAMQSVGYREVIEVTTGSLSIEAAIERMNTATWQYAKRQLTWFTRDLRYTWLASDPESNAQLIRSLMKERGWFDD